MQRDCTPAVARFKARSFKNKAWLLVRVPLGQHECPACRLCFQIHRDCFGRGSEKLLLSETKPATRKPLQLALKVVERLPVQQAFYSLQAAELVNHIPSALAHRKCTVFAFRQHRSSSQGLILKTNTRARCLHMLQDSAANGQLRAA